ncbi:MAG: flagellar motor switch protein FliM [bacterium]
MPTPRELQGRSEMVETLTAEEIKALLDALEVKTGPSSGQSASFGLHLDPVIKDYDFRRPDKFSKDQIRAFHMILEVFARSWGTFLSAKLRSMVGLEVQTITQLTYQEFMGTVPSPSVITVFSMDPLQGSSILEIKPPLAYTIVDLLLGGVGRTPDLNRELTEIEAAIIGGVISESWGYLRGAFKDVVPVAPRAENIEYNPQFVQIVPPSDIVLYASIQMKIGEVRDLVVFCFPFVVMEPVLGKLSTQTFFSGRKDTKGSTGMLRETLHGVTVPIAAELGGTQLTMREILSLGEGDVVKLETRTRDEIKVFVRGREKFRGRPGLMGENRAVEVTQVRDELGNWQRQRPGGS